MTYDASRFHGRQSPTERRYEAHLFLTCDPDQVPFAMDLARRRRFRRSSRLKTHQSGAEDLLLTRNSDDDQMLTRQLRVLADLLVQAGVHVYRIRLEEMVLDEVRTRH